MSDHPSNEELQEYLRKSVADTRCEEIGRHVEACVECQNVLDQLPIDSEPSGESHESANDSGSSDNAGDGGFAAEITEIRRILDASDSANELGAVSDAYKIDSVLGGGGMGIVFRGLEISSGRVVAIKFLRRGLFDDLDGSRGDAFRKSFERFRSEASKGAFVNRNLVSHLFQFIIARNGVFLPYFVMEYAPHGTLEQLCRSGRLSAENIVYLCSQVCSGLASLHSRGIIHRDIKLANLLRNGGVVKVTDFGISEMVESAGDWSAGTPRYMSPEQREGKVLTPASDMYSFGLAMRELMVGSVGRPLSVEMRREDIPDSVMALATQMLAETPSSRPTARHCTEVLTRALNELRLGRKTGEWDCLETVPEKYVRMRVSRWNIPLDREIEDACRKLSMAPVSVVDATSGLKELLLIVGEAVESQCQFDMFGVSRRFVQATCGTFRASDVQRWLMDNLERFSFSEEAAPVINGIVAADTARKTRRMRLSEKYREDEAHAYANIGALWRSFDCDSSKRVEAGTLYSFGLIVQQIAEKCSALKMAKTEVSHHFVELATEGKAVDETITAKAAIAVTVEEVRHYLEESDPWVFVWDEWTFHPTREVADDDFSGESLSKVDRAFSQLCYEISELPRDADSIKPILRRVVDMVVTTLERVEESDIARRSFDIFDIAKRISEASRGCVTERELCFSIVDGIKRAAYLPWQAAAGRRLIVELVAVRYGWNEDDEIRDDGCGSRLPEKWRKTRGLTYEDIFSLEIDYWCKGLELQAPSADVRDVAKQLRPTFFAALSNGVRFDIAEICSSISRAGRFDSELVMSNILRALPPPYELEDNARSLLREIVDALEKTYCGEVSALLERHWWGKARKGYGKRRIGTRYPRIAFGRLFRDWCEQRCTSWDRLRIRSESVAPLRASQLVHAVLGQIQPAHKGSTLPDARFLRELKERVEMEWLDRPKPPITDLVVEQRREAGSGNQGGGDDEPESPYGVESFDVVINVWCFALANYPGRINETVVDLTIRRLGPCVVRALKENVGFDIVAVSRRLATAAGMESSIDEVMERIFFYGFPPPSTLSDAAQITMSRIIQNGETFLGDGCLGLLKRKWSSWNVGSRAEEER